MEHRPLLAEILITGPMTSAESAELVTEFRHAGVSLTVGEVAPRRALEDIAWLALVAIPFKPFYEELAKNAATDGYRRLKSLTATVFRHVRGREAASGEPPASRVLVLRDAATGVQVVIEPDLPDEAYQQLIAFNLSTVRHGPVQYDRHHRRWRSVLDEAEGTPDP